MRHQTGGLQTAENKTGENQTLLTRNRVATTSPGGPTEPYGSQQAMPAHLGLLPTPRAQQKPSSRETPAKAAPSQQCSTGQGVGRDQSSLPALPARAHHAADWRKRGHFLVLSWPGTEANVMRKATLREAPTAKSQFLFGGSPTERVSQLLHSRRNLLSPSMGGNHL